MTTDSRYPLFNTRSHVLHAAEVGQDYRVGVWLPFGYGAADRRFPTLYVPDAEFAFAAACGLIPTLIGPTVPDMLVVGVAYEGISGWGEFGVLRERDMLPPGMQSTPGENRSDAYARFWESELIPFIERDYPADPAERAIYGMSCGGFYALNMALTRPGLFRRVISVSGTWPGTDTYFQAAARAYGDVPVRDTSIYLTVGALDAEQLTGHMATAALLSALPGVALAHEVVPAEGHSSGMIAAGLLRGLPAVYGAPTPR